MWTLAVDLSEAGGEDSNRNWSDLKTDFNVFIHLKKKKLDFCKHFQFTHFWIELLTFSFLPNVSNSISWKKKKSIHSKDSLLLFEKKKKKILISLCDCVG